MSVFYDNFIAACATKKVSPSAAAEAIGLSRTSPNGWKKGKQPSEVNLKKLSDYFGVPLSFFEEVAEEQKENPAATVGNGVSDRDIRLAKWFRSLPEETRTAILTLGGAPEDLF